MAALPASSWNHPRSLAHRGGGTLAPENTLAALDAGHGRGYRAAEIDAVLTADEVPVLLHDETLERTTDGKGSIGDTTLAQLARLDAGRWFGPKFAGTRVPTLEQALERCWALGVWLNIEIKPVRGRERRTGALVAQTVARFCASKRLEDPSKCAWFSPLLSSFSPESLQAARDAAGELPRGLLFGRVPAGWEKSWRALDAVSVHCDHRFLTRPKAQAVRRRGAALLCYTVDDPRRERELREWGVDAICTDRIDRIAPMDGALPG
jgi:glycerophosphoryl diester phosphodiesterase